MMYIIFHNVDFADYFLLVPFNMFPFPLCFLEIARWGL